MTERLRRSLLIVALVAVVSVVASVGMTINAEEPSRPAGGVAASSQSGVLPAVVVPGGPGFFSQSALSCQPRRKVAEWSYIGHELYNGSASVNEGFICPVSLPNGATVNKVVWYYYDNSPSYNVNFWMVRRALGSNTNSNMAFGISSGSQDAIRYLQDTSIAYPTIDMQSYAYNVEVLLPPNGSATFLSYRIDYQYGAYLPAVMKNSN